MKLSTLCLLAVTIALTGLAPVLGEPPKSKTPSKPQATQDPDQPTINAYLKALQDKFGYSFTLSDKPAVKATATTPAKDAATVMSVKAGVDVGKQIAVPGGSLSVDMTGIQTEEDVETKLIKALVDGKLLEEHDTAAKIPVYYRLNGTADIFKGAVGEANGSDSAESLLGKAKGNDYKAALDLKEGRLFSAESELDLKTSTMGGKSLKRAFIRVGGEKGTLVATMDFDGLSYQRAKVAGSNGFDIAVHSAPGSVYYRFNELLKKRAKLAGKGDSVSVDPALLAGVAKSIGDANLANLNALYDNKSKADSAWAASEEGQAVAAARTQAQGTAGQITQVNGQYEYRYQSLDGITHAIPIGATLPQAADKTSIQAVSNKVTADLLGGQTTRAKATALMAAVTGNGVDPATGLITTGAVGAGSTVPGGAVGAGSTAPVGTGSTASVGAGSTAPAPIPNLTGPAALDAAGKVGAAGCHSPADAFRSDAERYKAHQASELAKNANANQQQREDIKSQMDDKIQKIQDDCKDKLADPMLDGASKATLQTDCDNRVTQAKQDAFSQLQAISRAREKEASTAANGQTQASIVAYYKTQIANVIPQIQQAYKTGQDDQGVSRKAKLADEVGIDTKYLKDSYIDDYFAKNWNGDAGTASIDSCRTTLGIGTNPSIGAVASKCVHKGIVDYIKGLKGRVSSGGTAVKPVKPGTIDQQIESEVNGK